MKNRTASLLISDMLEAPALLRGFEPRRMEAWIRKMAAAEGLLLTGEGSSRIFPAKNLISQALKRGPEITLQTEGARQAAEYVLEGWAVLGASNSGQTKELVELFVSLREKNIPCYGVTAAAGSRLTEVASEHLVLSCGKEGGVAATKSVFEQGLLFQALLRGPEWGNRAAAAALCETVLTAELSPEVVAAVAAAKCLYIAGRNDGVAEELTLKANEIARKKSVYLEGTYALHGVEEIMEPGDVLLLVEPFPGELAKIKAIFADGLGLTVAAIASFDTGFPTLRVPSLEGFDGFLRLAGGWNLLATAGLALGVDIDKPARARKVGNAV